MQNMQFSKISKFDFLPKTTFLKVSEHSSPFPLSLPLSLTLTRHLVGNIFVQTSYLLIKN